MICRLTDDGQMMIRTRRNTDCPSGRRKATVVSFRRGKITDKQVFIIICTAAILVAAITLGNFFLGSGLRLKSVPNWECLECGHKFSQSGQRLPLPPIDCPQGHKGQAVMLGYRVCPDCYTQILYSRTRLTKEFAEEVQRLRDQGYEPTEQEAVNWPREVQFRLLDTDDQWTNWVIWRSPEAVQIQADMKCPQCGASLYPKRERKGSGGR